MYSGENFFRLSDNPFFVILSQLWQKHTTLKRRSVRVRTASVLVQKRVMEKEPCCVGGEKAAKPFRCKFCMAHRPRAKHEEVKMVIEGRFVSVGGIRVYYKEMPDKVNRAAVIASHVKGAAKRNKIKRLLREALWFMIGNSKQFKGVVVAKGDTSLLKIPLSSVINLFESASKKIHTNVIDKS